METTIRRKVCSKREDSPNETIITQKQHNNQAKERSLSSLWGSDPGPDLFFFVYFLVCFCFFVFLYFFLYFFCIFFWFLYFLVFVFLYFYFVFVFFLYLRLYVVPLETTTTNHQVPRLQRGPNPLSGILIPRPPGDNHNKKGEL